VDGSLTKISIITPSSWPNQAWRKATVQPQLETPSKIQTQEQNLTKAAPNKNQQKANHDGLSKGHTENPQTNICKPSLKLNWASSTEAT
jgi:hypothetical protein